MQYNIICLRYTNSTGELSQILKNKERLNNGRDNITNIKHQVDVSNVYYNFKVGNNQT